MPGNHEIGEHIVTHGDGVRDVAFEVDNIEYIIEYARKQGAKIVDEIAEQSDEHGSVKTASVQTVRVPMLTRKTITMMQSFNFMHDSKIMFVVERARQMMK